MKIVKRSKKKKKRQREQQAETNRFEEIKLYPECRHTIVLLWFYDSDAHLAAERAAPFVLPPTPMSTCSSIRAQERGQL